jgi:SAM-dependent methyltransferase
MAVDVARERYAADPGIDVVVGMIEQLPFEDHAFDACRVDRTLQHVADPVAALREVRRVLAPGGRLVVLEMLTNLTTEDGAETDPVAKAIWRGFWTERERRGWIGFMLPLLAQQAGFTDVDLLVQERKSDGYALADLELRLEDTTRDAIRAGRVDAVAGEAWLRRLERQGASGGLRLTSHTARIAAVPT